MFTTDVAAPLFLKIVFIWFFRDFRGPLAAQVSGFFVRKSVLLKHEIQHHFFYNSLFVGVLVFAMRPTKHPNTMPRRI